MHPALLQAHHIAREAAGRPLWGPLDLALAPGERLALVGPSGSGKSLLLRLLAGLDPLQSGRVLLRGRPLEGWGAPRYRAEVMYLPQRAPLYPGTVEDNLRLPFSLRVHAARPYPEAQARALLDALERPAGFLAQEAALLSGGEAQLVALARALLLGPSVLLLDEATSALDPATTLLAERLLHAWLAEGPERALVLVGHDPAQRERLATGRLELTPTLPSGPSSSQVGG